MKILVPVKQVARLREGFALTDGGALAADSLERAPNAWDAFSLEAALALRDDAPASHPDGGQRHQIVLVTVGGEWAEPALRAGLAMGADRAIRVSDAALDGADALAVAGVLAAVAKAESPELILCGAQSSDMAYAATGVALAGLLDLAHVAVVAASAPSLQLRERRRCIDHLAADHGQHRLNLRDARQRNAEIVFAEHRKVREHSRH